MADEKNNPFSVRMESEDKEKLLKMIQESNIGSSKEFMSVLMSAYELNKVKVEIPEASESIKKVEQLTQLINDNFVNMSKHIRTTKESMNLQFTKEIEIYKSRIETFKAENEKLKGDYQALQEVYNNTCSNVEDNKKQLEQLQEVQESNKALIKEYQSKIDTMAGIIEEYKGFKAENETLKISLASKQSDILIKDNIIRDRDFNITNLNKDLKVKDDVTISLKFKYESELKQVKQDNQKEIESLKKENQLNIKLASAEIKEELNNKLNQEQQKHNSDIQEYQSKYKALLEQMENERAEHTTAKKNNAAVQQNKTK